MLETDSRQTSTSPERLGSGSRVASTLGAVAVRERLPRTDSPAAGLDPLLQRRFERHPDDPDGKDLDRILTKVEGFLKKREELPEGDPKGKAGFYFYQELNDPGGLDYLSGTLDAIELERLLYSFTLIESVDDQMSTFPMWQGFNLQALYGLGGDFRSTLDSLLNRAVREESKEPAKLAEVVGRAIKPVYGDPIGWMDPNVKDTLPPYAQDLMERPEYAAICLQKPHFRLEDGTLIETLERGERGDALTAVRNEARENVSKVLKDALGVPAKICDDVISSYFYRFRPRDLKDGTNRKVDYYSVEATSRALDELYGAVKKVIERVSLLKTDAKSGVEVVTELYENLGIVNLDRYAPEVLQRCARVVEGDPATLERLKEGEVSLTLTDALGDHNNAFNKGDLGLEDDGLLAAEFNHPSQISKIMKYLEEQGIIPSTVVLGIHGSPGSMRSSLMGQEFSMVASGHHARKRRKERGLSGETIGSETRLDKINLGAFVRRFMQPHKETGERHIVLASCSQASGGRYLRPSTAARIVRETRLRDKVVVTATEIPASTKRDEATGHYSYWNKDTGAIQPAVEFRRDRFGRVSRREERHIRALSRVGLRKAS